MAARWMVSFSDFRIEVKEYIDAGECRTREEALEAVGLSKQGAQADS